jgi:RNA polymerase sigma-70 factor (ECF subfamily)
MAAERSLMDLPARLRAGENEAAEEIVQRFTRGLLALARARLSPLLRQKLDPEDVVQSVYRSFFRRCRAGQFDLASWQHLWQLLTVITLRKCASKSEHFRASRRDVAREVLRTGRDSGPVRGAVDRRPTPLEAAALHETVLQLLESLPPRDRPILEMSLQGFTVEEIGRRLGRAERTVWRIRERVRRRLQQQQPEA